MAWKLFRRFFTQVKATERDLVEWLREVSKSNSGASVTESTALMVTTVLACARILSQGVAQVPCKVYRETGDTYLPAKDHSAYKLLYAQPNDFMTSFEFREAITIQAVLSGFGYAWIGRGGTNNQLVELMPLVSSRVKQRRMEDGTPYFELHSVNGSMRRIANEDMFVLRGPSHDGTDAWNMIYQAREAIGLAMATEESHARLHANGLQPGNIITFPNKLTPEIKKELREDWNMMLGGLANKFKTVVLDSGAKVESAAMKGVDAQHLETRRFQIEEICRGLVVFPQMIGHTANTVTFASAEAFFLAHCTHSLQPWIVRWEQALARALFADEDDLCVRFHMQALLRGDSASRAAFYKAGIVDGWLTRNEARRFEELNPLPGLDKPLMPMNYIALGPDGEPEEPVAAEPDDPDDPDNSIDDLDEEETDDETEKAIRRLERLAGKAKNMLGHNRGPRLTRKVGRVLSAKNEQRIRDASEKLNAVLATLPPQEPKE